MESITNLTSSNKNDILDPLSIIIKMFIYAFKPVGTKISIGHNKLYIQENTYIQGAWRRWNGDTKNDINILLCPILYACIHYLKNKENYEVFEPIFKVALDGLTTMKQTYAGTPIIYNIEHIVNIINLFLDNPDNNILDTEVGLRFPTYKKLVSNSILAYSDENNRKSFFSQAAQLESLVAKNPRAWNKFINNNVATRIISSKVYLLFKNLGANSKALSQSLRQMPPQSPLWALLEPALEFGLYQFGLYLENPSAYSLETPENKIIRQLNARINEIMADPKIRDKRKYFIDNYGSYLKILGSMEKNELLSKFPVMSYDRFLNIGRNIGQK